jgi:hypothetical protein
MRTRGNGGFLAILLSAACVPGCGGEGDSCRDDGDCRGDLVCVGPDDFQGCGIGPAEGCASDSACSSGTVCHAMHDPCSEDGVGSRCDAPCTGDASCGEGFWCSAGGACEAVPCTEGTGCRTGQVCDPGAIPTDAPVFDRHDGCFRVSCHDDGPCEGGSVCVNGSCQSGTGTCRELTIVP